VQYKRYYENDIFSDIDGDGLNLMEEKTNSKRTAMTNMDVTE